MPYKKRVLIFSLSYFPHVGGAEVALKELTDRMSDIEFHMITMNFGASPASEQVGNVFVHRVGTGSSYFSKILFVPRAVVTTLRITRSHTFDWYWAMMSYMVFPIVLLRALGDRTKYILTLQDGDPFKRVFNRPHILFFLPLLKFGFRKATRVTAISTYLAHWAKRLGFSGGPLVIPNGADVGRFSEASPSEDFQKKTGETWLVTTSRLVKKNALDDVIRALVSLPNSVKFLILGDGPEHKHLQELAKQLSVSDRVQFMGYVAHDTLPGYLKVCTAFVRPSRTEGFGASFPEAMAAGLPVIATQEGGIADFLFDEHRNPDKPTTGFAVDVDSPLQIADAVKEIMTNPVKVERVRENAFRMVIEKYNWDHIAPTSDGV
jgi:glycosyltransferase involved in cell wall biosynthesis